MQQTERGATRTVHSRVGAGGTDVRRLHHDLRYAVREANLCLAFHPRWHLRENVCLGAEAQVKWACRGHGVLSGTTLISLGEACGVATEMLAWTLGTACAAAAQWTRGVISVSAPAAALRDGELVPCVAEALTASALPPDRLEITLRDDETDGQCEASLLAVSALRDLGIGVALEEFGRTQLCLAKLRHLPLSAIKLDRSLVRDAACDPSATAMVRALIGYAHALDIEIAAWVEKDEQRALLHEWGCDAGLNAPRPARQVQCC